MCLKLRNSQRVLVFAVGVMVSALWIPSAADTLALSRNPVSGGQPVRVRAFCTSINVQAMSYVIVLSGSNKASAPSSIDVLLHVTTKGAGDFL